MRTRLPERFGEKCHVLVRGKMNNCLVEFEDGHKVVTSRNYVRKLENEHNKCRHCGMTALYAVYDKGRTFCSFECKTDWEGHVE